MLDDDVIDPADRRRGTLRAFAGVLTTLITVAALGGSAYWLYLKYRDTSLTTRGYRAMTLLGRQLNANLDGYRAILISRTRSSKVAECRDGEDFGFGFECDRPRALPPVVGQQPEVVPVGGIATYFTHEAGHARVHLCTRLNICKAVDGARDEKPSTDPCVPSTNAADAKPICVSKSLDGELAGFRWDLFGFDALAVVTGDGSVVAQQGSLIQRIRSLADGFRVAHHNETEGQWFHGPEKQDASTNAGDAAVSVARVASNPDVMLLAGRRYLLFSWGPLPDDGPAKGDDKGADPLWLIGFVPEAQFRANVYRIPYAGLISALVILLLLLFSWQLLKIRWLAPQERLHGADVRILGLSILGLVGLLTILLLAYSAHTARVLQQDDDLRALGGQLADRLRKELRDSFDQLSEFRSSVSCRTSQGKCAAPRRTSSWHLKNLVLADEHGNPQWWFTPAKAPDALEELQSPPRISFADRPYFTDAQSGQMWQVHFSAGAEVQELAVQVVRGRISNEYELVVARPLEPESRKASPVLLVSTDPHPFDAPVLPEGFGFAVVNRYGDIQFHSENSRNLSENLIEETDNNLTVRTALATARSLPLNLSYSGNEYAARIASLQGPGESIPWSIVVFREQYVLRALNSETLLGATALFSGYVVIVVLMLVASQLRDRRYHAKWLWPERRRSSVLVSLLVAGALCTTGLLTFALVDGKLQDYPLVAPAVIALAVSASCLALGGSGAERRMAIAGGAGGIAILVARCWQTAGWYFPLLLAALWGAVYLGYTILCSRDDGRAMPERTFRAAYLSLLAAMTLVLGVLPAALMVGASARHIDRGFAKLLSEQRESRRHERETSIMSQVTDDRRWIFQSRCRDEGDIYTLPDRDMATVAPSFADAVFRRLPPVGDLSERLHVVLEATAPEDTAERHRSCCDPAEPDACVAGTGGGPTAEPASAPSGRESDTGEPLSTGVPLWLLVAGTVCVVLFLLADAARRIFLLDVDGDGDGATTASSPGEWRLTRRPRPAPSDPTVAAVLDAGCGARSISAWRTPRQPTSQYATVEITNVDVALGDDASRAALRGVLEELVYATDMDVVLTSTENPLPLLLRSARKAPAVRKGSEDAKPAAAPPPAASENEDQITPWLVLLACFEFHPVEVQEGSRDDVDQESRHWLRWRRRSRAERLALAQLAAESFLNPNNGDVVRGLVAAGVLRRDRGFVFADSNFESFVRRAVPQATIRRWEREGVVGGWEDVRTHLAAVLGVAGTFIFLTQPDLFNTAALTLAGVAAGVPTLTKLLSMFGGDKREAR